MWSGELTVSWGLQPPNGENVGTLPSWRPQGCERGHSHSFWRFARYQSISEGYIFVATLLGGETHLLKSNLPSILIGSSPCPYEIAVLLPLSALAEALDLAGR